MGIWIDYMKAFLVIIDLPGVSLKRIRSHMPGFFNRYTDLEKNAFCNCKNKNRFTLKLEKYSMLY